ncbi:MAG: hypothetical protein M3R10_00990 [Verrucomicrobiota bacterium]|nr:hypothetical protein [Verrucomicrobiota bacterium]
MQRIKTLVRIAFLLLGAMAVTPQVLAQTNSTWVGQSNGTGNWNNNLYWNPQVVPNGNFNATITRNPNGDQFNGPELDVNISLQNLSIINRVFLDNQSFPGTNLTVNGTTSITTAPGHDGETAALFDDGGTWLFGTLTNYNSASHTLTDGFFFVFNNGTIGWHGADITTNQGGTLITSGSSRIIDQDTNLNAFRNLAVNNGGFTVADGYNFTTAGNFTNNGGLGITTGNGASTIMTITGSLTNFDSTSHTLTNGFYDVEDTGTTSGIARLRFANADIRTLVTANIKLVGPGASITDLNGLNALRNLSGIQSGSLTSAGTLTITPSGGTFSNDNSTHTIDHGANITIQGNHHSMNGGTTNIGAPGNNSDTTLSISGNSIVEGGGLDMGGEPGVNTQYHTQLQVMNGIEFRGAYLTGTGTTFADVGLIQGSVLNPGHSPGQLTFQGNLTMDNSVETDIQVGGYAADNNLDQIFQSGGTLTIGGRLLISFLNDFDQTVSGGDNFDIFTSSGMVSGSFSNAASGARIATNDGKGTFVVNYSGMSTVTLSAFLPPPRVVNVTKAPGENFTIYFLGYPNSTYDLQASPDLNPDNFQTIASFATEPGGDYVVFGTEDFSSADYTTRFYRVVYPGQSAQSRKQSRAAISRPRKI